MPAAYVDAFGLAGFPTLSLLDDLRVMNEGSSRKNLRGHCPGDKGEKRGSGGEAPNKFFDHALFVLRKRPMLAQRLATYT